MMDTNELGHWLRGVAKEVEEGVISSDNAVLTKIINRINEVRDDENIVIPHEITVKMAELKQIAAASQLVNVTQNIRVLTSKYSEAQKEIKIATQIADKQEKNLIFPKLAEQSTQYVAILEALKSAFETVEDSMNDGEKSVKDQLITSIDALKKLKTDVETVG